MRKKRALSFVRSARCVLFALLCPHVSYFGLCDSLRLLQMSDKESEWKPSTFYIAEPPISPSIEKFFAEYASIPSASLREHLLTIRERAWQQHHYPCLGRWAFLDFSIGHNPIYAEILDKCRTERATVIDFGCCLGQDVRQLVYDGVSVDQIRGYDIDPFFIEQGYDLFHDGDRMKEKKIFAFADIFDDQLLESIEPADYVHVGSFIHLFDAQTQKEVCRRLTRLCKRAIVGRQVGSSVPGEHSKAAIAGSAKMMRHSPESFAAMWIEVTDGTWKVESATLQESGMAEFTQRLIFVVRKTIV